MFVKTVQILLKCNNSILFNERIMMALMAITREGVFVRIIAIIRE
jgi:hypothetical protein